MHPAVTIGMTFQLTTDERHGATVVTIVGELDIATAPQLAEVLDEVPDAGGPLAVDLTGTEFVDSTGVRTLANAARTHGGGFALICPSSNIAVTRVLELTGFGEALTVHESLDALGDPTSDG